MEQRTEEWHNARKGMITGSAVGAILGCSPFVTPDDVMRRMVREYHGAEPEFVGNVATEYGTFHESGAIFEFTMETGLTVEPCGFFVHPDHDWLGASPDGLLPGGGLIEVKCPYGKAKKQQPVFKPLDEQEHYKLQIIVQMACAGVDWAYFYQWAPGGTAPIETVYFADYKEQFDNLIVPALHGFYERYLTEREVPGEHLEEKRVEISTMAASKLVAEYQELGDAIDRANERKKDIMADLIKMSKGRNADVCGHLLTKVERAGSVSYAKALKKYAPDADLEPFRGKPTEFWKLS